MTKGNALPYQLRPNKAVDRLLFVELLEKLDGHLCIRGKPYRYYGFGAPQMEEYRILHDVFPKLPMTSIEKESHVSKRQQFNAPHSRIAFVCQRSSQFISQFTSSRPSIFWLDYVVPGERADQIAEFQELLRKCGNKSVIRITLNASASSLREAEEGKTKEEKRYNGFVSDFGRFFTQAGLDQNATLSGRFPNTLLETLESAASEALADRKQYRFQPLQSCVYADGQKMLTVTGILVLRSLVQGIKDYPDLRDWQFSRFDWKDPIEISVPELTTKERLAIDQRLPRLAKRPSTIERQIGCSFGETKKASAAFLRRYIEVYRHYPMFGKIHV